jgi:hypothetical protein
MPLLLPLKRNYSNIMAREVMSVHQAAAGPIPDISQQPPSPANHPKRTPYNNYNQTIIR